MKALMFVSALAVFLGAAHAGDAMASDKADAKASTMKHKGKMHHTGAMNGSPMNGNAMSGNAMQDNAMHGGAMSGNAMHGGAMQGNAMHGDSMQSHSGDAMQSSDKNSDPNQH